MSRILVAKLLASKEKQWPVMFLN